MINRSFFALFLASCATMLAMSARAQVSVSSHTNIEILNNQKRIVPLCQTVMVDTTTRAVYINASVVCTANLNGAIQTVPECFGNPVAFCQPVLATVVDGGTYQATARHGVVMKLLQPNGVNGECPASTGLTSCYWDPLSYGLAFGVPIPPGRIFNDKGQVPFSNTQSFWNTSVQDILIATTAETPFQSAQVLPFQYRSRANDVKVFNLNGSQNIGNWTLTGTAGTLSAPLQGNTVTFNAPKTVPVQQVDTITACKADTSHGTDCNSAQITVEMLKVTLPPSDQTTNPPTNPNELLGGEQVTYKAIVTQGSVDLPSTDPASKVTWTLSDPSGLGLVSIDGVSGKVTVQPQDNFPPNVDFFVDIQATSTVDPAVAFTAPFAIHIPTTKVVLSTTPFPEQNEPPFEGRENRPFRFVATVTGPHNTENRLVTWGQDLVSGPSKPGAFNFSGPDGDTTDYIIPPGFAPAKPVTVKISACVGGHQDEFHDQIQEICDSFNLNLVPPVHMTSASPTINSGESTQVTITGTGFGAAPIFHFSDPTASFAPGTASGPDANGVTTVIGTITVAPVPPPVPFTFKIIPVTITSSLPPPSTPVNQDVIVRPVTTTPAIAPANPTLIVSQSQQFTPSLGCQTAGGQTCTVPQTATCSLFSGPGTMSAGCLYTAPASLTAQTTVQARACFTFGNRCSQFPINLVPITVAVSPATASLASGQSKQFQATVTNVPGNNQSVTWSINPPTLGSITSAGLYTAPAAVSTAQTVSVIACSVVNTTQCSSATVSLVPPDFAFSAAQNTGLSTPFIQYGFNLTVTSIGGFTGNVTLSATLPAGIGMSSQFSPATIPSSGNSVATFPVLSTTPAGSYPVTITATSGGLVHSLQITVTVAQPTLSLTVSPPQTAAAGQTVTYTFAVSWTGFVGSTSVNVTGIPPGSTATQIGGTFFGPDSGTLTITTPAALASGTYNLTFTATGGGLVTSGSSSLNVNLTKTASTTLTIPDPPPPPDPGGGGCVGRPRCINQ